jgi:PAS domain S-box-containing protein
VNTKPIKILIVEDEPAHVEAIRRALNCDELQAEITVAGSLREYHDALAAGLPDLAIIDLVLPDGRSDGLLTSPPEAGQFPTVVMTSHGDEAIAVGALKAGALDYIVKSPDAFATMPRSVKRVLREWNLLMERKRAEKALRASEEKFRVYVEQAADALFVHDFQGRYLDVNRWACESLGYSRAELLGMNVLDIEQDFSLEGMRRVWSNIQPDQPSTLYGTHRRKDGTLFPVEVRFGSFELEGERRFLSLARNITRRLQAEETLRAQNDLLHMTGEIASLGGWELDTDTGEVRWTEEINRIHEVDLDRQPDLELALGFYTDDSRPKIERAVQDAITRALPYDMELEIVTAKSSRKWVRTKGVPVVKDGKVVQLRGIFQDITERKRTEASLEESQARMAAIVKTAVDAIITIDGQGIVWSFNPAAEKIFGYSSEEIVGKNVSLLMPPPHREQHAECVARFKSTGERDVLGVNRVILALRKDGSTFPMEIGVSEIHVHGNQMFVGILRDVSERKLAQDALRRSEQRYRRIVETAREGVWVHDVEGRTTFVNARMAEMLGYSVGELEGRPVIDFVVPQLRAAFQVYLERRRQGIGETHDFQFRCHDGSPLWAIVSASPLKDDEGRVIGVLKMITDITERRWAEQELMASERRFRDIARNIPGVVYQFRVRPDGTHYFSYVSPRAQEILNLEIPLDSPDWFLGSGVHPDDRNGFLSSVMEAISARSDWRFEGRVLGLDGQFKWIQGVSSPHVEEEELVFNGVAIDITGRKQAEEEVRALNACLEERVAARTAELESMLANATVGLAFFDRDVRFIRINHCLAEFNGIPLEAHLGRSLRELLPVLAETVEPIVRRVFETGKSFTGMELQGTTPARPGELRSFLQSYYPVLGLDGTVISVGATVTEITEQKQAGEALAALNMVLTAEVAVRKQVEQQMRRLADIVEASPDFVGMADSQGRIFYFNRSFSAALGRSPERVPLMIADCHPASALRIINEEGLPSAARTGVWRGETDVVTWEGRTVPVSQIIIGHHDAQGRLAFYSTIMRDMSERQRMEAALRHHSEELVAANAELARASRLKDEFLASMSHELRTPLYGVLSMSEAMQEEVYGPVSPRQASALQDIATSGRHLMVLINDILDVAKIDAGKLTYEPGPVDVAAVCESSIRLIKESAHKMKLQVFLDVERSIKVIETDEKRLKQVLVNLLSNAVKFTPTGGSLGLDVVGDSTRRIIALTVWDKGIGIQEADLSRIFEPFTQVDSGLARQYAGTGLGLSLVRKMTGLLGGVVLVRSEPGRGSRFTIELPWKDLEHEQSPDQSARAPGADASSTAAMRVEPLASYQLIRAALAEIGIQSMVHPCSLEALPRIRSLQPALIVIEDLPGDPVPTEILRRLAGDPDPVFRSLRVLLISGDIEAREFGSGEGVLRLTPPVTRETLQSALGGVFPTTSGERLAMILVPESPTSEPGPLVLLAEDNEVNARSVVDFLQTKGMRPVLACDGDEAVRKALDLRPRVILMDIQMPGRDGLEAIRVIKSNRTTMGIPIVALTALAMPGDRERCLVAGADAYLSKPVVLRDLFQVLCRFLGPGKRGNCGDASGVFDQPDLDC